MQIIQCEFKSNKKYLKYIKANNMEKYKLIQYSIKSLLLTLGTDILHLFNSRITNKERENVWNLQNSRGEKWYGNNLIKENKRKKQKTRTIVFFGQRKKVYIMKYRSNW